MKREGQIEARRRIVDAARQDADLLAALRQEGMVGRYEKADIWEAIPATDCHAAWEAIPEDVRADLVAEAAEVIARDDYEGLNAPTATRRRPWPSTSP